METWLAWLPALVSVVFFAVVASRILRAFNTLRDPDALSKALSERLEKTLGQPGLDPAAAHELRLRLREELEKGKGSMSQTHRLIVEQTLERMDAESGPEAPAPRPDVTLRRDFSRPTPIDVGASGSALRFAVGLCALVVILWIYYSRA